MATRKAPDAPSWTPAPPPPPAYSTPLPPTSHAPAQTGAQSGMLKAGTILLLVGAILHAVGAAMLVVISLIMLLVGGALADEAGEAAPSFSFALVGIFYLVFGIILAIGSWFGFSAWNKAKAGELHRAWIHGLVSALLPPLQLVTLLGAIFVLVSPEHEAQERAKQQGWAPPR